MGPGVYAGTVSFGARGRQASIGPVIYFTPADSRFRPFVQVGGGFNYFYPTDSAKSDANSATNPLFGNNPLFGPVTGPVHLGSSWKGALNMGVFVFEYGTGFKYKITDHFGIRADLRGNLIQTPTFDLSHSNVPAYLSIDKGGAMSGLQATAGVSWYLGKVEPPPAHTLTVGEITAGGGPHPYLPRGLRSLKLPVTDSYSDATIKYTWTTEGGAAGFGQRLYIQSSGKRRRLHYQGSRYGRFFYRERQGGDARLEEIRSRSRRSTRPYRFTSIAYSPPTLACSANPTSLNAG